MRRINESSKPKVEVLVVGPARGGTTLGASILAGLGFSLIGDGAVLESADINEAYIQRDAARFRTLVRDKSHRANGPLAMKLTVQGRDAFRFIEGNLSYSLVLIVFKNPLSVAQRRTGIHSGDLQEHLGGVMRDQLECLRFLSAGGDTIALDVDKFSRNPKEVLLHLSKVFGQALTDEDSERLVTTILSRKQTYLDSLNTGETHLRRREDLESLSQATT